MKWHEVSWRKVYCCPFFYKTSCLKKADHPKRDRMYPLDSLLDVIHRNCTINRQNVEKYQVMSNEQRKVRISSIGSGLKPFSPFLEKKKKLLLYPMSHAFEDTMQNRL